MRLAWLALCVAACAPQAVNVDLRVAEGQHPLSQADRVSFSLVDGTGRIRFVDDEPAGESALGLSGIPDGSDYVLALSATFEGQVIASGRTCPFDIGSTNRAETVPLYFGDVATFAATVAPSAARLGAVAFVPDGAPLIAGGAVAGGAPLGSSDRFDPTSGQFVAGPSLNVPRVGAQAVTLPDGVVLIQGGAMPGDVAAESYAMGKFTPIASTVPSDLVDEATVALPSGTVLVIGGHTTGAAPVATALLVSEDGSEVDDGGSMLHARARHTATLVGSAPVSGVAIVGGTDGNAPVGAIEIWEPALGFSNAGTLTIPRSDHTATLLPSGLILIAGGVDETGQPIAAAEVFDPVQRTILPGGALRTPRSQAVATLLPSGRVLISGGLGAEGQPIADVELFDPSLGAAGDFVAAQPLTGARAGHALLPNCDGTLLAVGGGPGAELYTPSP